MAYDIIIGRSEEDKEKFEKKGLILLGKSYVKMGRETSLFNPVYLDVARSHVILVSGKKGSGKSYSLSVIAEGILDLPEEIKENMSVIMLDSMGIFWTMKYENKKDEKLLEEWGLRSKGLDIDVYVPRGFFEEYKKSGVPADYSFAIQPKMLNSNDWCNVFNVDVNSKEGVLITRVLKRLLGSYSIIDILYEIEEDNRSEENVKNSVISMFQAANSWGLFDENAIEIEKVCERGRVGVIDLSCYSQVVGNWSIKALVVGLISAKILAERIVSRKEEEMERIEKGYSYFSEEESVSKMPMVWMFIDELHEFLAKDKKTAASDALTALLREGRQPGISLVLATQQIGKIHDDAITQADIVLCHRITAKQDVDALNEMMQSYMEKGLTEAINELPREAGAGVVLDDSSERLHSIRVRPKLSWHGGEAPSSVKVSKRMELKI